MTRPRFEDEVCDGCGEEFHHTEGREVETPRGLFFYCDACYELSDKKFKAIVDNLEND
jgi:hypothetical protein